MTQTNTEPLITPAEYRVRGVSRKGWIQALVAALVFVALAWWALSRLGSSDVAPTTDGPIDRDYQLRATSPDTIRPMRRIDPGELDQIAAAQRDAASRAARAASAASEPADSTIASGTVTTPLASTPASAARPMDARASGMSVEEQHRRLAEAERRLEQAQRTQTAQAAQAPTHVPGAIELDETPNAAGQAGSGGLPPSPGVAAAGGMGGPLDLARLMQSAGGSDPMAAVNARMQLAQAMLAQGQRPQAPGAADAASTGPSASVVPGVPGVPGGLSAGANARVPGMPERTAVQHEQWSKAAVAAAGATQRDVIKSIQSADRAPGLTIRTGDVIPVAVLGTAKSDLPGSIRAVVTKDVYDSVSSSVPLIPQGTVFNGTYMSDVGVSQDELPFVFTRMDLPNGTVYALPGFDGAGSDGRAGVAGEVNNHFLRRYGTAFLMGVLADRLTKPSTIPSGFGSSGVSATGQVIGEIARSDLARMGSAPRTITVTPGTQMLIKVKTDMVFDAPYQGRMFR